MPGAAPPSFLVKSQSLEIKDDEQMKQELPVQSTSEISLCSGSGEEKPILFESEQEVETLKSVTKVREHQFFFYFIVFNFVFRTARKYQ